MMTMKQFGDWDLFNILIHDLSPNLLRSAMAGQREAVTKIYQIVRGHLRNQDLPWRSLNAEYAARKDQNADKILVHTWKYYESIKIENQGNTWGVGVRRNLYYSGAGGARISVAKAAMMHELGYNNLFGKGIKLPKRPLWKPSIKEFEANGGLQRIMVERLRTGLQRKGWGRVTVTTLKQFKAPV